MHSLPLWVIFRGGVSMAKKMKREVVEYEFTGKTYGKVPKSKGIFDSNPSGTFTDAQTATNNQDQLKVQFLKGNPFMYNPKTSAYSISSFEEYFIKVRKDEYPLGDIVRNPNIVKRKKKTYLKKAFQRWDKEYNTQKKSVFKESDKTIEVIGDVNFMSISIGTKLMIIGLFILMIFVVSLQSYLWEKISSGSFGYRIYQSLVITFSSTSWLKLVANITIYVLVLFVFYATIYSMVSKDFVKTHKLAVDYLKSSEKTISKQYKKKYRKAYSYYMQVANAKKKFYPPLDMAVVEEGQVNITVFEQIRKAAIDRAYNLKKRRPLYVGLKNIFLLLSAGGCATVIGYALFQFVTSLF
jgi:hypothetical protein